MVWSALFPVVDALVLPVLFALLATVAAVWYNGVCCGRFILLLNFCGNVLCRYRFLGEYRVGKKVTCRLLLYHAVLLLADEPVLFTSLLLCLSSGAVQCSKAEHQ